MKKLLFFSYLSPFFFFVVPMYGVQMLDVEEQKESDTLSHHVYEPSPKSPFNYTEYLGLEVNNIFSDDREINQALREDMAIFEKVVKGKKSTLLLSAVLKDHQTGKRQKFLFSNTDYVQEEAVQKAAHVKRLSYHLIQGESKHVVVNLLGWTHLKYHVVALFVSKSVCTRCHSLALEHLNLSLKTDKGGCFTVPLKEYSILSLTAKGFTQKAFLDPKTEKKWWSVLKAGNINEVENILTCFAVDINKRKKSGAIALNIAADTGRAEFIEMLIKHGADVNKEDRRGWAALHVAAAHNYQAVIRSLIKHGADVNKKSTDGFTPLHLTVSEGWYEATKLLREHCANVNETDREGATPLDTAIAKRHRRERKNKKGKRDKKSEDNERIISLLEEKSRCHCICM